MFSFVLQKMKSNLWKVLCLLLGCILVVGMFASIPIFTKGILQRMFIKQLDNRQTEQQIYSGYYGFNKTYRYSTNTSDSEKARYLGTFTSIDSIRAEGAQVLEEIPYSSDLTAEMIMLSNIFYNKDTQVEGETAVQTVSIGAISGMSGKVSLVAGRMYQDSGDPKVYEAVITERAMQQKGYSLGQEIPLKTDLYGKEPSDIFTVKIVGVVAAANPSDPYWYVSLNSLDTGVIMDYDTLMNEAKTNLPRNLVGYSWWSVYDYYDFSFTDAQTVISIYEDSLARAKKLDPKLELNCTFIDVLQNYPEYKAELETSLQILFVPIILMLAFYIYMVSQLMVTTDKTSIAVMESRGAGKRRIVLLYLIEYSILAAVSFVAGPLLGLMMCKVLGSSNGFLTFVGRTALPVEISMRSLVYAGAAMIFFVLVTLVPVFLLARKGIVETKRTVSRRSRSPVWQRYCLDFVLLGISLYIFLQMKNSLADETSFVSKNDSLLFLASTLFIMGAGMFFLRIYPLFIRFIYFLGRKRWSPVLYTSFLQVSRTDGREQFLMLFIVLALSVGIFNANAARTINQNSEDEVSESIGSDLVIREEWTQFNSDGSVASAFVPTLDTSSMKAVHYEEPSMSRYENIDGVENAARVLNVKNANKLAYLDKRVNTITVMGIDPEKFGQIVWSRDDILPFPINSYLNAMTGAPGFAVISQKVSESLGVKEGDILQFSVDSGAELPVTVLAVVDYWPGLPATYVTDEGNLVYNSFIVMDLDYYLAKNPIEPYEVWIKKDADTLDQDIYKQIADKNISVESIKSEAQSISAVKNDPQLQGLNGALSLGFIVSMLICAVGFLIYWIISIQGRVLQFGIYRAMGMSKKSILGIIGAEQILISGVSIAFGILIGDVTSTLYLPLFKILNRSDGSSIPYKIITLASDYIKIYTILGAILLICFAVLSRLMLRIRIDQAVKLGEE